VLQSSKKIARGKDEFQACREKGSEGKMDEDVFGGFGGRRPKKKKSVKKGEGGAAMRMFERESCAIVA